MNRRGEIAFIEIMMVLSICALIIAIIAPNIFRPKYEAKLYNERYGTSYTWKDFMFAGETIKSYLNEGENKTLNLKINKGGE
jgi:hypothetical protein